MQVMGCGGEGSGGAPPYAQAFFMLDLENRLLCYGHSVNDQRSLWLIILKRAISLYWNALIPLSRIKIPFLKENKNINIIVSANGLFTVSHKSAAWGGLFTVAYKFLPCEYFKSSVFQYLVISKICYKSHYGCGAVFN